MHAHERHCLQLKKAHEIHRQKINNKSCSNEEGTLHLLKKDLRGFNYIKNKPPRFYNLFCMIKKLSWVKTAVFKPLFSIKTCFVFSGGCATVTLCYVDTGLLNRSFTV